MHWWLMLVAGATPGAAVGALGAWLWLRGAARERDLAVQRGNDLRAALTESERTIAMERDRRVQDCARLEEDLRASEMQRHHDAMRARAATGTLWEEIRRMEADLACLDTVPAARERARRLLASRPGLSVVPPAGGPGGDPPA